MINCFAGDMTTLAKWWGEWKQFMFVDEIKLPGDPPKQTTPSQMLLKIKHSK